MEITHRTQLPDLLKHLGLPMIGAEIGVASGFNSLDLMRNGMEKLYCVDNWGTIEGVTGDGASSQEWHQGNYESTLKLLKPFGDKVTILKGMSVEMAKEIPDNSLGLLYHDGNHTYLGVKEDIEAYWAKLVENGIMAFHDYANTWDYGVKDAVDEFAEENGLEVFLIPEDKIEDAGAYIIKPKK